LFPPGSTGGSSGHRPLLDNGSARFSLLTRWEFG
jgi:hypothetical protein